MFRSNRGISWALSLFAVCGMASAEVRLSTTEAMNAARVKPPPSYPPVAKQLHITGKVEVEVTIDKDGNVSDIKMLSGNALFSQSIIDALKRWKFTPAVQNGAAIPVIAMLSFVFNE